MLNAGRWSLRPRSANPSSSRQQNRISPRCSEMYFPASSFPSFVILVWFRRHADTIIHTFQKNSPITEKVAPPVACFLNWCVARIFRRLYMPDFQIPSATRAHFTQEREREKKKEEREERNSEGQISLVQAFAPTYLMKKIRVSFSSLSASLTLSRPKNGFWLQAW